MKRRVSVIILIFTFSGSLYPFSFSVMEVLGLLKKISTGISCYSDVMDDYYQKFSEFYQTKWAKYYNKFSIDESVIFDSLDVNNVYEGQKVDREQTGKKWNRIFEDPEKLKDEFPNIFFTGHYKTGEKYYSDPGFRKNMDKNIRDGREYLENITSFLSLVKNIRDSQKIRGKKAVELKKYIKNFSMPKGRNEVRMGRLIAIETIIEHEIEMQLTELITLINARTEINVKNSAMAENFKNRNYRYRLTGEQK